MRIKGMEEIVWITASDPLIKDSIFAAEKLT